MNFTTFYKCLTFWWLSASSRNTNAVEWDECNTEESFDWKSISSWTSCMWIGKLSLTNTEVVKFMFYALKQVWSAAEFILRNYEIQRLICGNFYVSNVDIVFIAFYKNENLRCQQCGEINRWCPQVVAVTEK